MSEKAESNRTADTVEEAYARDLQAASPYLMSVAAGRLPRELWSKVAPSDIVQEALYEATRSRNRPTGSPDHFKAWLRTIVVNKVIDVHRRFCGAQCRDAQQELPLSGVFSQALESTETSPSGVFAQGENRAQLIEALARLPESQREAIVLREFDCLTFPEIGIRMGRSPAAARSLWWRALESLRSELEATYEHSGS